MYLCVVHERVNYLTDMYNKNKNTQKYHKAIFTYAPQYKVEDL